MIDFIRLDEFSYQTKDISISIINKGGRHNWGEALIHWSIGLFIDLFVSVCVCVCVCTCGYACVGVWVRVRAINNYLFLCLSLSARA